MNVKTGSLKRIVLLIVGFLSGISASMGQLGNAGYFNQANRLFSREDYYAAAQYYEKYLVVEKKPAPGAQPFSVKKVKGVSAGRNSRQEALYHLAECYRMCHDYTRAEKLYKEATSYPAITYPLAQYWYGVSLRANGKYEEAMLALTTFKERYTNMDVYLAGADREIKNLQFIKAALQQGGKDSFVIRQQNISGLGSAYAASMLNGDTIVFTGIRPDEANGKNEEGNYNNRLYFASPVDDLIMAPVLLKIPPQPAMQDGMASFSEDGKKMFFTRWDDSPGQKHAAIYESERTDTGWSQPVRLNSNVNEEGFNSAQPFVAESLEGKYLLFSSDRPGGLGNYDLWYATMDSGYHVLYVNNMGGVINSPGDEQSPFFHKNSRTLVFSSNGRPGMGGYDIYSAKGNISLSNWERPENPGIALNSPKDDLYFMGTDEENLWNTGWLSSDRASDCCLSLFSFRKFNSPPDTNFIRDAGSVLRSLNSPQGLVGFAFNRSSLRSAAYPRLDSLVALLQKYPTVTVSIDGYTDGIGGEEYNLRLARARVDASIRYLVKKGIGRDRLKGRAMGKCCPLAPEIVNGKDDPEAREKNRRIEYTILPQ